MVHIPETNTPPTGSAVLDPLVRQRQADEAALAAQPAPESPGALAELIALRLKAQGLTPRELEQQHGDITDTTWGRYLRGSLPSRSTIPAIALALGLPASALRALVEAQREALRVGVRIDTLEQAQAWVAQHASEPMPTGGA